MGSGWSGMSWERNNSKLVNFIFQRRSPDKEPIKLFSETQQDLVMSLTLPLISVSCCSWFCSVFFQPVLSLISCVFSSAHCSSSECRCPVFDCNTAWCDMGPSATRGSEWRHSGLQGSYNILYALQILFILTLQSHLAVQKSHFENMRNYYHFNRVIYVCSTETFTQDNYIPQCSCNSKEDVRWKHFSPSVANMTFGSFASLGI